MTLNKQGVMTIKPHNSSVSVVVVVSQSNVNIEERKKLPHRSRRPLPQTKVTKSKLVPEGIN